MRHSQFHRLVSSWLVILLTFNRKTTIVADGYENEADKHERYELCKTKACTKAASELATSISTSMKPCDGFFEYSCGEWQPKKQVLDDVKITTQRDVLEVNKVEQLHEWFHEMSKPTEALYSTTLSKVVNYYLSCTNLALIDRRGVGPLKNIVRMNGRWPLSLRPGEWNIANRNLTLQKIHDNYLERLELSALFEFDVRPFNDTVHRLHLVPPKQLYVRPEGPKYLFATRRIRQRQASPESESKSDKEKNEFVYVQEMAKKFARRQGGKWLPVEVRRDHIREMLSLKKLLLKLYSNPTKNRTRSGRGYAIRTIGQIQNTWNREIGNRSEYAINWLKTIRSAFKGTNITVQIWNRVVLKPENIISKLAKILIEFSLETVVNYVHWAVIPYRAMYTNKKMREIVNDYATDPYGHDDVDDYRSYTCIEQHKMHVGLSYAYAKRFFSGDHRTHVRDIVFRIKDEIVKLVGSEAKKHSKNKLEMLIKNIGYPSWYDDDGKMDDYHSELEVDPDFYFENVINYDRFQRKKSLKKLRQPYNKREARSEFVLEGLEAMNFQLPFYHVDRPWVANYGAIGGLVGYELARALIDRDQIINGTHGKNTACFVKHYDGYTILKNGKGLNRINGTITLKKNIADYIGFTSALRAFISYKRSKKITNLREPSFTQTSDGHYFFLALANRFCESISIMHASALIKAKNLKSIPNRVRINGALSNIREFSEAFECEPGSPMNPIEKCHYGN